jgi:hypothetical protein
MQAPIGLHVRNNAQLYEYPFVHRQHMSAITLGGLMVVVALFENALLGFIGGSVMTIGCRCPRSAASAYPARCVSVMRPFAV